MAKDTTQDQYFEIEVSPPSGAAVYSYLRIGTWNDNQNPGAEAIPSIMTAASAAAENPTAQNLAAFKTAAKLNHATVTELDRLAAARNTAHAARATEAARHDQAKAEYDAVAEVAEQKHEAQEDARREYEDAVARNDSANEQARKLRLYRDAKEAYDVAHANHEAAKRLYQPAKERMAQAHARYLAAKLPLLTKIKAASEEARNDAIEKVAGNEAQKKRGHDLAMQITDFNDDTRNRGGPDKFEHLTVAERMAESAVLHTRGGWRDHTEGNRISTTRGDKIEVIRGNYRRMVLGRQDSADEACLLDASGGLYMDGDFAPGSVVLVEYSTKYDGTWKVVEEANKGDVYNKYHGDVEEHFYGNSVKSFVGRPGGATWEDATEIKPVVEERTWAKSITSETWVDGTIEEETHASKIRETTRLTHSMHSNTTVGAGVVDMLAVGAGLVEMTTCGASHIEMEASTTHLALELAPISLDLYIGARTEIVVAAKVEIDVGPRWEVNASTDFKLAPVTDELASVNSKITAMSADIAQTKTYLSAVDTDIGNIATKIKLKKTEISGTAAMAAGVHLFL